MINFRWGNPTLSLPKSRDYIRGQLKSYITDGDKQIRTKIRNAFLSIEDEGKRNLLKSEFSSILKEVLEEPIEPLLKTDEEGWKQFSRLNNKEPNMVNLRYLRGEDGEGLKTIGDVTDAKLLNRLKGTDTSFIRGGKTKIPNFDFSDDFMSAYGEEPEVVYDISLRPHSAQKERYLYSHDKNNSELDAHMEISFPNFEVSKLEEAKASHILEETGMESKYKQTNKKFKLGKETINYGFNISEEVLNKLQGETVGKNYLIEVDRIKEDDKYIFEDAEGSSPLYYLDNEIEGINKFTVEAAIGDLNRTEQMKLEEIIEINGVFYLVKRGQVIKDGRVRIKFEGNGTPDGFINNPATKQTIMTMINKFMVVPDEVYSVKIYANIKTAKSVKPSYKDFGIDAQAGKGRKLQTMEGKDLSVEEIEEQSSKAYSHNTEKDKDGNKKFISEEEYSALPAEEKKNYKSEIRVYDDVETPGRISFKVSKEFGLEESRTETLSKDNIKEAFKKANVVIEVEVTKHGEYNLSGGRGRQNRSMAQHTNKIKRNVRKLKNMIGD